MPNWCGRPQMPPPADLSDPALARESMEALDELTTILALGPVYDFQH